MKEETLIVSNHHRRSFLFEESISKLFKSGFKNIWIQDTGMEYLGKYNGPCSLYWNIPYQSSYDNGMSLIHSEVKKVNPPQKYILFIDNDLFFSNTNYLENLILDSIRGNYDFVSYHVSESCYTNEYDYSNKLIHHVRNQEIIPTESYPGFVPRPHWENALMFMKLDFYKNCLTEEDVGHGRKWIAALIREGAKIGAHRASYKTMYSHHGPEWFHVGNLFQYYYKAEQGIKINTESTLDLSRIGYFFFMGDKYGYFDKIQKDKLESLYPKEKCLESWNLLTKNTCMEN